MEERNKYDFNSIENHNKGNSETPLSVEDLVDIESSGISKELNEEKIKVQKKLTILKALVFGSLLYGSTVLYGLYNDNEVMAFSASTSPEVNAPQRLSRIEDISVYEMEHYLKDFIRQYLRARYPKNESEVKFMYEFIRDHSDGEIERDFSSRIHNLAEINDSIRRGMIISIYPKNSLNIQIRKSNSSDSEWKVLIPVRKVKRIGIQGDERTDPNIEMTIKVSTPTLTNLGFTVTSYTEVWEKDPISKEIKILNK